MSPSRSRQKRVPPARSGPIRNPLLPASGGAGGPLVDESLRAASRLVAMSAESVCGALEGGVQTAYAVIDEYMRRGYEAARSNQNPNRRGHMSDNRENYGNWQIPFGPMGPFIEQWSTAMRAWAEAWSAFFPGGWPQQPWNPAAAGASNAAGPAPVVSVQVQSPMPAEVTANLRAGADGIGLEAGPLQGAGVPPPVIDQVSITREPGRVRVSVKVGAGQPPGCYFGAIRNKADGSVVGDLTVVITESA